MYYATIKNCDIANGPGVRVSLFVSGCTHHCPGCFNEVAWDFHYGEPFTQQTIDTILEMLAPAYIRGLTLLGGEPFEPENQQVLLPFLRRVREKFPDKSSKSIWSFTGFTLEELKREGSHPRCEYTDEMLAMINVLVDGPFVQEKKNISLQFRGSENQRVIDLDKTREAGSIVLWSDGIVENR